MKDMLPNVEIDAGSGFCFGVVTAIKKAEEALSDGEPLYCLGDIVHNSAEVERLRTIGLNTISHSEMAELKDAIVLLRAHGEPPSTYKTARERGIKILDATCPVVLQLQKRIKENYDANGLSRQIVIYGKEGHAEVNGLVGQTDGNAIVVQSVGDLNKIDFSKPISIYSQTTMSVSGFREIINAIVSRIAPGVEFESFDTICRQVANRVDNLRKFAASHHTVLFVSGTKSSNGRFLFSECRKVNERTFMIADESEIDSEALIGSRSVGICGATSTPRWLMEKVRDRVTEIIQHG